MSDKLKVLNDDELFRCQRCHQKVDGSLHTCPYSEEINVDSETICNCCEACEHECAMDI